MHIGADDYNHIPTNAILSAGSGALGFIMANWEPILTVGLPILFFTVGKAIDVAVKLYIEKRKR